MSLFFYLLKLSLTHSLLFDYFLLVYLVRGSTCLGIFQFFFKLFPRAGLYWGKKKKKQLNEGFMFSEGFKLS